MYPPAASAIHHPSEVCTCVATFIVLSRNRGRESGLSSETCRVGDRALRVWNVQAHCRAELRRADLYEVAELIRDPYAATVHRVRIGTQPADEGIGDVAGTVDLTQHVPVFGPHSGDAVAVSVRQDVGREFRHGNRELGGALRCDTDRARSRAHEPSESDQRRFVGTQRVDVAARRGSGRVKSAE